MRRGAIAGFTAVLAVGLIALVVAGLTRGSTLVYSPGATPAGPYVPIAAGQTACQGPIAVPDGAEFDRVTVTLGTYFQPGPELRVDVRDGDRVLASGTLPAGYPDIAQAPKHVIEVGRVATRAPLQVCLHNVGARKVAVYGQPAIASPRTFATLDGQKIAYDMGITLNREKRSLLALLPDMADRASLFRAGWVSPFVYLILGLLVLIAAPALLARGLAGSASSESRASEPPVGTQERAQEPGPAGAAEERRVKVGRERGSELPG